MESYRPMIQNQIPNSPTLPPVPTTKDELLIAALRHANVTSGTLNYIRTELFKTMGDELDDEEFDHLHDLPNLRLREQSALHLFIAAHNLGIELPPDLQGDDEGNADAE